MQPGQVPSWITVVLAVLAVVGTVGGAWGGQLIAGRNERRRWERERRHERETYWRDRRLNAYSEFLASASKCLQAVFYGCVNATDAETVKADLGDAWPVKEMGMIAPTDVIELCSDLERRIFECQRLYEGGDRGEKLTIELDTLDAQLVDLHNMFRRDLGVAEMEPRRILPQIRKS